jgi:hypothetical protein
LFPTGAGLGSTMFGARLAGQGGGRGKEAVEFERMSV